MTTDNQPEVSCAACGGTGKVLLSGVLLEVFLDVQQHGQVCAQDVWGRMQKPNFEVTAVNNRLENLRRIGLVIRERIGRNYLYSLNSTPKP
ncbi:MAG: hypothetical protein WC655_05700 [Candidatus Hydrogenedentales bacterium]